MITKKELFKRYPNFTFNEGYIEKSVWKVEDPGLISQTIKFKEEVSDCYFDSNGNKVIETIYPHKDFLFNQDASLICFWYAGMLPEEIVDKVIRAFEEKNWELFKEAKEEVESLDLDGYGFPNTVTVFFGDTPIGDITEIDEYLFNLIDENEYELG